jgi:hypothetical protein
MSHITTLSLAALMTSVIVLSPEAKAQQTTPALPGTTHDNNSHYTGPKSEQQGRFDPELEARADRMFGKGKVYDPARIQWMAGQEQRAIENDINRTKPLVYPVGGR